MIKFFRKIRQRLLSENKFSKYLIYAIGEIVLVVIGILIALSINNWNENQKLRNIELLYLIDLKEEFSYNKNELLRVRSLNDRNINSALELINNFGLNPFEITEREFGRIAGNAMSVEVQFNPSQGILDEIISSGKLNLISNKKLKFALSTWNGIMTEVKLQEQEIHRVRYLAIDIMRNEGNLRGAFDWRWLESLGIKKTKSEQGNLHLLNSLPYEGHVLGYFLMSRTINLKEYLKIGKHIDEILLLINDELKSRKHNTVYN